jgi:hypothetical protein
MKEKKVNYMNTKIYKQSLNYFEAFGQKDINALSNMFSSDIILTDWLGEYVGKEKVLEANLEIFKNDFEIILDALDTISKISYARFRIIIGGETIKGIDVIEYNKNKLIKRVTAYKG